MAKKVLVPIAQDSEEIEAVCIIDTLSRAGAKVTVASVENNKTVKMSRGVVIVADKLIQECENETYDCIAVPGGMPGAERCRDSAALTKLLKDQKSAGRIYAAICASPAVVFEHHGLLQGETAVAYPSFMSKLSSPGTGRVVVSNKCVTSIGPGSALEFSLALVKELYGEAEAKKIQGGMCVV